MTAFNLDSLAPDAGSILLFGGGGHGKTLIDLVRAAGQYRVLAILDDGLPVGTVVMGVPVLGGSDLLPELYQRGLRLAINGVGGINHVEVRLKIFELLQASGFVFPTLVHPTAWAEPSAGLADGVQVLAKSYISSEVHLDFGTVVNAGVVVSHDCRVGRVVNLSPGAMLAGGVTVEDYAQIGMAATVNLNITIGRGARVGNGATVKSDVPAGTVVRAGTIWPVWSGMASQADASSMG
jgi:sugar O-acyltransferase (sialic acid O-acetyltransferase NeuD family)